MSGTFDGFVRLVGATVMLVGIAAAVFAVIAAWRMSAPLLLVFASFAAASAWYGHRVANRLDAQRAPIDSEVGIELAA